MAFMPEFAAVSWIGLRHDAVFKQMWQARYDHTAETPQALHPVGALNSIPVALGGKTKDVPYRDDVTPEGQHRALESALSWAWAKHTHLTGVERPDWSRP